MYVKFPYVTSSFLVFPIKILISQPCYIYHPPFPPWFHHLNNILWTVQITKLLIV
jgi:hypothetical protein